MDNLGFSTLVAVAMVTITNEPRAILKRVRFNWFWELLSSFGYVPSWLGKVVHGGTYYNTYENNSTGRSYLRDNLTGTIYER